MQVVKDVLAACGGYRGTLGLLILQQVPHANTALAWTASLMLHTVATLDTLTQLIGAYNATAWCY